MQPRAFCQAPADQIGRTVTAKMQVFEITLVLSIDAPRVISRTFRLADKMLRLREPLRALDINLTGNVRHSDGYEAKIKVFAPRVSGDERSHCMIIQLNVDSKEKLLSKHEHADALSLMLAVITSSSAPLVLLDGNLEIIAASASFCRTFEIDPKLVSGKQFASLGQGEWDVAEFNSLLEGTAAGVAVIEAYEFELKRDAQAPRLLVLNGQKLDYDNKKQVRILLAVADVTDLRAREKLKDDLLHERAMMLKEVQHRVANSLQIIASILMQSARKVQSTETRGHLQDAHSRLMSIAAVQRHLAEAGVGDIELRPYLVQLCKNLGASMIHDTSLLTIEATVDDSVIRSDISVSLGLIVTELVINALKHAFPDDRAGHIRVVYQSHGSGWTLSVSDNGVGVSQAQNTKSGLGTNIVQALAQRLNAEVHNESSASGTHIKIAQAPMPLPVALAV